MDNRPLGRTLKLRMMLYPVVLISVLVIWVMYTPSKIALYSVYWPESVTMILGAFVAGSTPLGGGAVAFPVLTKMLSYAAEDARLFSLLIQSVGMSCASILFISMGRTIFWREILFALPLSTFIILVIMPSLSISDTFVKGLFTVFELVALIILTFSLIHSRIKTTRTKITALALFALLGGALSSTIGSGADLMIFIYLVLFKRVAPVEAIPTTVVFMAMNAVISALFSWQTNLLSEPIILAWFAAVPVVAVAAPLGGYVISKIPAVYVLGFIICLVVSDLASTILMGGLPVALNVLLVCSVTAIVLIKLDVLPFIRTITPLNTKRI